MANKKEVHFDSCPKSCREIHVLCDWEGCAKIGKHRAADHSSTARRVKTENKPTHTPGPWTVEDLTSETGRYRELYVRSVPSHFVVKMEPWDTMDADARLIAAAPELLAAAKRIIRDTPEPEESEQVDLSNWQSLRAAIAKAEQGGR